MHDLRAARAQSRAVRPGRESQQRAYRFRSGHSGMMGKRPKTGQPMPIGMRGNPYLRAALGSIRRRLRELAEEKEAARREIAELRRAVAEQTEYLDELAARVQLVLGRDDDLRAMLLGAHEQLMNRADEIRATLAAELLQAAPQQNATEQSMSEDARGFIRAANPGFVPNQHSSYHQLSKQIGYRRLVQRIREAVRSTVPPEATVAVVSKGDEELLELGDGRRGWHFPQDQEGVYAGYHPADSAQAIDHLEELRAKGVEFLLFPGTAFWWFEHYREFSWHLEGRYRRVLSDEDCVIYELAEPQPDGGAEAR
jgi:hypothetical protein